VHPAAHDDGVRRACGVKCDQVGIGAGRDHPPLPGRRSKRAGFAV
jgi:hypothetical protein